MRRRILIRRRIILKIDEVKRIKGNFRMKTKLVFHIGFMQSSKRDKVSEKTIPQTIIQGALCITGSCKTLPELSLSPAR